MVLFMRKFLRQPLGFENLSYSNHVFKLSEALYGIKQAPNAWYERLSTFLQNKIFRKNIEIDTTLFLQKLDSNLFIMQIYVDDIIIGSSNISLCENLANLMMGEFEMSLKGNALIS